MTVYRGQNVSGWLYLIHFDEPYKHAKHYTGWTTDVPARLRAHATGNGARLMEVITEAGITWRLTKVIPGTRTNERSRKGTGARRWCPACQGRAAVFPAGLDLAELGEILSVTNGLGRVAA